MSLSIVSTNGICFENHRIPSKSLTTCLCSSRVTSIVWFGQEQYAHSNRNGHSIVIISVVVKLYWHCEHIEMDDLQERVDSVTDAEIDYKLDEIHAIFEFPEPGSDPIAGPAV